MKELFGVSMTTISLVCVVLTAMILVLVALIAVRNPVMFKMGLRNIPRRKAQTTLIVVGLMLSTLIMSAAFGTGDTLATSVTSEVYKVLGEADEVITFDTDKQAASVDEQNVALADVESWQQQFANDPDIEAFVPFNSEMLPVQNQSNNLNESAVNVVGFRSEDTAILGGLKDLDGNTVTLSGNELAVNEDLAEEIDAKAGDTLLVFYNGEPIPMVVKALVPGGVLSGSFNPGQVGASIDFETLAGITGQSDADGVFVSNVGGVKDGMKRSDAAMDKLEPLLASTPYTVEAFKQDNIRFAELLGNAFTSIFVLFGLFSIAAGVLLIFLIFVMLAAERKPEMGMARAVGAKRRQLVESFLAEGMGYDLGSAIVGLIAGIGVTYAMVSVIKAFAGDALGLDLVVSFSWTSLVTAFCIGVIATFIVIFIASWRASRLNITSAIRDLPETSPVNLEAGTIRGYIRAALNAVVAMMIPLGLSLFVLGPIGMILGVILVAFGLISVWFYALRRSNVALPRHLRVNEGPPKWPWIIGLIPVVGWFLILPWYFIALGLVVFVRDRKPSKMPMGLAVAGAIIPPLGLIVALLQDAKAQISWSTGIGYACLLAGVVLTAGGLDHDSAFLFLLGVSLIFLFIAVTLRYFGIAPRLSFTVTSLVLLAIWYLPSSVIEPVTGELNGDIEMFFLSGMVMVTAAVFVVVYNADIVLPLFATFGSRFGRIMPAIKTGIAYPLTARFRTGMTMVMIGLIMFSLVMMATMNTNFAAIFLNDDSRGGFDVLVNANPNNPIDDLDADLAAAGVNTGDIRSIGEVRSAFASEAEIENRDRRTSEDDAGQEFTPDFLSYRVIGANDAFFETTIVDFKSLAAGYSTKEEAWQALREDPTKAVLPASVTAPPDPFSGLGDEAFKLELLEGGFEPFTLEIRDPASGNTSTITVIGVMKESADTFLAMGVDPAGIGGIVTGIETVEATWPDTRSQTFYLALNPGVDSEEFAKSVESALVSVSADSFQALLDEQQSLQNGFLLVFQGFMGLGLIVGIAALAVVSSRAVVERRQQIGMLRAIGYQRSMVALSFLFESGFIAISGILLGLTLGLSLAWVLFVSGEFGEESKGAGFIVPWLNLAIICGIAFVASMLMTFLPARGASRVPVAEALRYE